MPASSIPATPRLLNEPAFLSGIGDRGVRSLDQAGDYLQTQVVPDYRRPGHGFQRLALREGEQPIGICGMIQRDWLPQPDLGYALLPEYNGNGYAREAARAVLEHGRAMLGLGRVLAITHTDNQPSMRLLEDLGFHFEGVTQSPTHDRELNLFASDPIVAR